jgi:ABC-2 type transport system ATP-binding protein
MKKSHLKDRIPFVLGEVGLPHARNLELKKYSKGMLQRVGIAQALLHQPEFLILDEPMSGLDPVGRKEIRELIFKLRTDGHTIFFSSHVIPDVEAICDQVTLIEKGRILGSGPIQSFFSAEETSIEIIFMGPEFKCPQFQTWTKLPAGYRATVSNQKDLDASLPQLLARNCQIQSVQSLRPSLEDFFQKS